MLGAIDWESRRMSYCAGLEPITCSGCDPPSRDRDPPCNRRRWSARWSALIGLPDGAGGSGEHENGERGKSH